MHDVLVEVEDFIINLKQKTWLRMTIDHELTNKTFAFVDTIDDLESDRKQTGY